MTEKLRIDANTLVTPGWCLLLIRPILVLVVLLTFGSYAFSYSVLTHEEIVDLLWTDEIRPILLNRFPNLTEQQINEAHAHAYGGAVIQDLGYYPFGSVEFSNLVHYVRSGDFVRELLLESQDANEYAFAMGALAHYASDNCGHPTINLAVAIQNPKLRAKFGDSITFAQSKTAHVRTEFGFDVVQVARHRYATPQYHDFIGFKVSTKLLERAFPVVYGLELKDVLPRLDFTVRSYRYGVSQAVPAMTKVALEMHRKEIVSETPNFSEEKFLYSMPRSKFESEWGKEYSRPGIGSRMLTFFLRIIPKIGPLRVLEFSNPTPQTEEMYIKSIKTTVDQYRALLEDVRSDTVLLENRDLDSGRPTMSAEYSLADDTYAKLLSQLTDRKFKLVSADLREDILQFYSGEPSPITKGRDMDRRQQIQKNLAELRTSVTSEQHATSNN